MKVTYEAWLMRINQVGWMIYLVKKGGDISDYYSKKHDHLRNKKDDVIMEFGNVEPPDFISWEYESESECYKD